jgi:hypothetical protein
MVKKEKEKGTPPLDIVDFTLDGEERRLTRDEVIRAARRVGPQGVRTHAVRIDRELFPIKDVFAAATGLDVLDFTTNHARSVLKRLGFQVVRVK